MSDQPNFLQSDLRNAVQAFGGGQQEPAPSQDPQPAPRRRPAKFETMARIEGRITKRQVDSLDKLRKQLCERRTASGERITNNTLLRVALEVMLQHRQELRGNNEKEILESWQKYVDRAANAPRPGMIDPDMPVSTDHGADQEG